MHHVSTLAAYFKGSMKLGFIIQLHDFCNMVITWSNVVVKVPLCSKAPELDGVSFITVFFHDMIYWGSGREGNLFSLTW